MGNSEIIFFVYFNWGRQPSWSTPNSQAGSIGLCPLAQNSVEKCRDKRMDEDPQGMGSANIAKSLGHSVSRTAELQFSYIPTSHRS